MKPLTIDDLLVQERANRLITLDRISTGIKVQRNHNVKLYDDLIMGECLSFNGIEGLSTREEDYREKRRKEEEENMKYSKSFMKILMLMLAFLASACASTGVSFSPEFFSWGSSDKVRYVKISLTNSNSFSPSNTTTILLVCRRLHKDISDMMSNEGINSLKGSECRPARAGRHDASTGIFPGFGSAVVNSAAVFGGAYFIGKGLKGSGDTTNLNNASESNSELNESYTF